MRSIATAVAALALVTSAAYAQGNGNGRGNGGGGQGNGGNAGASMQGGGGQGNAERGNGNRGNAERGNGGGAKERGNARGPEAGGGGPARAEQGNSDGNRGRGNDAVRVVSDDRGQGNSGNRGRGNDNGGRDDEACIGDLVVRDNADRGRGNDSRLVVLDGRDRGRDFDREVVRVREFAAIPGRGVVAGCPPGLAKKNPPCVPPGQVRSAFRGYDRPDFWGLRLDDGRYRYDDGYLVRLNPDGRIGGYIPLLGGALGIGHLWPTYYQPVALPTYYESYYGLGPYDSYRYADNVIYQVDPETAAITSIAALLTGDQFVVGQPMPLGYDVYNVPYAYRDQYYDRPDAYYRYSDGYVYQVDPETRLIAAAIELLAS